MTSHLFLLLVSQMTQGTNLPFTAQMESPVGSLLVSAISGPRMRGQGLTSHKLDLCTPQSQSQHGDTFQTPVDPLDLQKFLQISILGESNQRLPQHNQDLGHMLQWQLSDPRNMHGSLPQLPAEEHSKTVHPVTHWLHV